VDDRCAEGAEWGEVWKGVFPPHPTRGLEGLGERRELPQWGPGRSPGRYHIFCIFCATESFW